MKKEIKKGEIIIYKTKSGPDLDVRLEEETVWLTQNQIAVLFGTQRPAITRHLNNIFKSKELNKNSVSSILEHTATDGKIYKTQFYNLDAIISIGYRINSARATQFRIWATKTLRNYLIKGYAVNKKVLLSTEEKLKRLQEAVSFFQDKSRHKLLTGQEQEILRLLSNYSKTLTILDEYDRNKVSVSRSGKQKFDFDYIDLKHVIAAIKKDLIIKKQAGDVFGQEYGEKFKSILSNIHQSFGGKELYPSIEEKAAHFLYFTIKDHPFVDGNKRIASFLFVYFLDKNNHLYKESGEKKINDNALTALALLIAVSDPKEKDTLAKIITNLIR